MPSSARAVTVCGKSFSSFFRSWPVFVDDGKAVDDDGDGQGEDEHPGDGAEAADELAQEGPRVGVVPDGGEGHEAPPEGLDEGPGAAGALLPARHPLDAGDGDGGRAVSAWEIDRQHFSKFGGQRTCLYVLDK